MAHFSRLIQLGVVLLVPLLALFEPRSHAESFSEFNVEQSSKFHLKEVPFGLNLLFAGSYPVPSLPQEVVLLIHGINEEGDTWNEVLPTLLRSNPKRRVFLYHWNNWTPIHLIEGRIGQALNDLIRQYGGQAKQITVIAHSAGGVLLLKSLCHVPGDSACVYKPDHLGKTTLSFHTVASPLGGLGYGFGAKFAGLFAGAVFGLLGQDLTYGETLRSGSLKIWYTLPENDSFAKVSATKDNRFPQFESTPLHYTAAALPKESHVSAVSAVLSRLFGI